MTAKLESVEDIDRAIAEGLLPDDVETSTLRARLEFEAYCKERGIPMAEIKVGGACEVTLGANGEVVSVAKDGELPVTVPAVNTSLRN